MVRFGDRDSIETNEQGEYSRRSMLAGLYRVRVTAVDYEPLELEDVVLQIDSLNQIDTRLTPATAVEPGVPTAREFSLAQNYPNPFNNSTQVEFDLPRSAFVTLRLYNILGAEIETLVEGQLSAGTHRVMLDSRGLGSGVYFYHLSGGGFVAAKKMVLLK
jgi:hypothetical protein